LHVQANQRAERLEAALAERDGESVRLRSRIESAEGEAQACRGKHEAALAAHQAERLRLEERNVAATSRWLTEVDRVRQNAKEQERHLKDFQRQVTQLLADRNALRQEIQGARAHLKTAIAVREQLELRLRDPNSAQSPPSVARKLKKSVSKRASHCKRTRTSPLFARVLPFGWDGEVAAFIMRADRWGARSALMQTRIRRPGAVSWMTSI
jgi:chromosome segregation ATPase